MAMTQEMSKSKLTFKSSAIFHFDFFFSFWTLQETINTFSHELQNRSNNLFIIFRSFEQNLYLRLKPSDEIFKQGRNAL